MSHIEPASQKFPECHWIIIDIVKFVLFVKNRNEWMVMERKGKILYDF